MSIDEVFKPTETYPGTVVLSGSSIVIVIIVVPLGDRTPSVSKFDGEIILMVGAVVS
jgi:hypothetical protein